MRKFYAKMIVCLFALALLVPQVKADNSSLVADFDEATIYNSFSSIDEVSNFVAENENVSYADLATANLSVENLDNSAAIAGSVAVADGTPPLISAFWWGCLTGPIGIVVTAVTTDNDKAQIKSAALGCAIPVGCTVLSYLAYFVIYAAAAASAY